MKKRGEGRGEDDEERSEGKMKEERGGTPARPL